MTEPTCARCKLPIHDPVAIGDRTTLTHITLKHCIAHLKERIADLVGQIALSVDYSKQVGDLERRNVELAGRLEDCTCVKTCPVHGEGGS